MATTYTDCITFTGETSDFTLKAKYKEWDGTVEYSTDHNTWAVWNGTAISSSNKKLYLRGSGNTTFYTSNGAKFALLLSRAACSGNIQTLLEYSNPPAAVANSCYRNMFSGCTLLTQAPELPATTLADYCYYNMFNGCSNLTAAPELPATTLASSCYRFMFTYCTKLTAAPELPATTLADSCYMGMFSYCKSLTMAPELPATTLASSCYYNMFNNCTSLKISTTQSSEYPTAWRIPSTGTISSTAKNWNYGMLGGTGGTFTYNPSINTTYYGAWSSVEIYPKINSFTYHGKQINNINGKHIRYVHDKRAGMNNTYEMVYVVQLATPIATASGTTVSWVAVENATSYEIFVGGSSFGTVSTTSVDLSTLSGWASLTDGEYNVTIVAKADGYRDSEPSAAVSVTKSSVKFVQIFPTTTPDNYTLIENLNQSKIYSIQRDIAQPEYITYLKYENGLWKLWTYEIVNGSLTGKTVDLSYLIYSQTDNSVKFMAEYGSYFGFYTSGITIEGDIEATKADFAGFSPTTVYAYFVCFVEGTKITLSNGSTKLVQDIQYGDKVLCYDFTNGVQTTSYIDWKIPERIATKYWEITLSDGTILNLVGSNSKSHRLYNVTKQRFDYPQDFEADDLTLKEDGTTARVVFCKQIEKTVKFYNIASHEHINVYANGVLTSNRLNNKFKIVDNKFTDEKVMSDKEVADYINYLNAIRANQ